MPAGSLEAVDGPAWSRTGTRSDGAHFTVESFARDMVHDPIHDLHDVHDVHDVHQNLTRLAETT
jgi:hypothetical protein